MHIKTICYDKERDRYDAEPEPAPKRKRRRRYQPPKQSVAVPRKRLPPPSAEFVQPKQTSVLEQKLRAVNEFDALVRAEQEF